MRSAGCFPFSLLALAGDQGIFLFSLSSTLPLNPTINYSSTNAVTRFDLSFEFRQKGIALLKLQVANAISRARKSSLGSPLGRVFRFEIPCNVEVG